MTRNAPHADRDIVGDIMAYENGDLSMLQVLELFGHLIRSGMAWSLQGSYGRTAQALIDGDLLTADGDLTDRAIDRLAQIPDED